MDIQEKKRQESFMRRESMRVELESYSHNEQLARVIVAAYMTRLNPTVEETEDVKTAVSEAVTNAIIHGYKESGETLVLKVSSFVCRKFQKYSNQLISGPAGFFGDGVQLFHSLFTDADGKCTVSIFSFFSFCLFAQNEFVHFITVLISYFLLEFQRNIYL